MQAELPATSLDIGDDKKQQANVLETSSPYILARHRQETLGLVEVGRRGFGETTTEEDTAAMSANTNTAGCIGIKDNPISSRLIAISFLCTRSPLPEEAEWRK